MKRVLPGLFLTVLLATPCLWAETTINERRGLSADGLIELNLIAGTIKVTGWQKSEMELTGMLHEDDLKVEISGGKDRLKIEIVYDNDEDHRNVKGADVELRVPRGARVRVETVSAPITVSEVTERIDLNTVSGNLQVQGSPKEAKLSTVSGEIVLDDGSSLEMLETNTVSGSTKAHVRFRSNGSFSFNSVSGAIELRLPSGVSADFDVSTFSGSIHNDFGHRAEKSSSFLPSETLSFRLGSGEARVRLNSFSGPIKIRKE